MINICLFFYLFAECIDRKLGAGTLCVVKAWAGYYKALYVIYFECLYYPP